MSVRPGSAPGFASARVAARYRIEQTVGRGGMGAVYRVFDESAHVYRALKRPTGSHTPKELALFEREYHTLAGIRHPHVVEVYDYGADAVGPFYTMELLEGSDLRDSAPLPWREACAILRDVASALAILHARRLLHRDVSSRNAWRCPDGRIKLIDFGALAAFGTVRDVAGTPPFVAPEALHGRGLDQRTDLYSLGALGYWLLTAQHAFPARELSGLSELWRKSPKSAGSRVRKLQRADLPEIPEALDALLDALLSRDPLGRPGSAGEVIDRLSAIAQLEPEKGSGVVESYLGSAVFVGRRSAREQLSNAIKRASEGNCTAIIVEAAAGLGRTRLLNELALEARLKGFMVLQSDAQAGHGNHSAVHELCLRALDAMPVRAKACASPLARTLGHLSQELCERLGLNQSDLLPMPQAPGEARMRIQAALRSWFLALAGAQPLALLVDDLDAVDEASAALLAALAHGSDDTRLFLVSSLRSDAENSLSPAVVAQRQLATRIELEPMDSSETFALLSSVFGEAPHLQRVAELLHRIGQGSPAHTMELAEYLVKSKLALYLNGTWVLPQTLEEVHLPATRSEMLAARLKRLTPKARALSQVLSIHQQSIPLHMCAALSELEPQELFATLELLVREGVLLGSADGYRFRHEGLRRTLLAELDLPRSRRAHKVVGELLMAAGPLTTLREVEAGVHLLLGGERENGARAVARAALQLGMTELTELGPAAPWLSQALRLYRDERRTDYEQVALLAPLALAGYYVDRRLADQYGDEAVTKLQTLLGLPLARRLRPFLGRKLSLLFALVSAMFAFRRNRSPLVPSFHQAMVLLFNCVAALTGVATICIDPRRAKGLAQVIEPLTALGKNHVATLMHEFCTNLASTVQDRIAYTYQRWGHLIAKLEDGAAMKKLPENLRTFYLAGALYARGVIECWRDDSKALQVAERLDALALKLYEMSADQVRMMYYGNRGDMDLFEGYRKRVEMHAIQRGTAWQAETWASGAAITICLRTYDATRMRQAAEELRAISREVKSLKNYAVRARGALLLLRGMQGEAIADLEEVLREEPLTVIGWARSHGALARAYNDLGAHARAREVCEAALSALAPEDLEFPAMHSILQIELALAEAGLQNFVRAAQQLEGLIALHEPFENALTLGSLHDARARVAQLMKDQAKAEYHLSEMERFYRSTGAPALVERCERMLKQARPRAPGDSDLPPEDEDNPATVVELIRHGGSGSQRDLTQWSLERLVSHVGVAEGYLYAVQDSAARCAARVGETDPCLDAWASERLALGVDTTRDLDSDVTATDHNETQFGDRNYRLIALYTEEEDGEERLVGGLVLPSEAAFRVEPPLLRALTSRLKAGSGSLTLH